MRARIAAGVALAFVLATGALVAAAGDDRSGARMVRAGLAWEGTPRLITVKELPNDRILAGRLVNGSLRTARLDVERIRVVDAAGRAVRSSVRLLSHFAHGVYSPDSINRHGAPGEAERRRLGEIATLRPRESVPITVSWRVPPGSPAPVAIDLGPSRVTLR